MYEVEIMADSLSETDHRCTTLRVVFPRIVLAEFNTHRLFSRNSASSRAIPGSKLRQRVIDSPFVPDRFPLNHKGMQAGEWVEKTDPRYFNLKQTWLAARNMAVSNSEYLNSKLEVSKQIANRIIEPWVWHEVIVTATEWENFFALRAHPDAQNEIKIAAEMMLCAMNDSHPRELKGGQWHLPFGDKLIISKLEDALSLINNSNDFDEKVTIDDLKMMVTVARCARVSYLNFEGKDDYLADVKLYQRLKDSGHMSPFEHVARAMTLEEYVEYRHSSPSGTEFGWCGNFRGFIQARKLFPPEVENRLDPRLKS